MSVLCVDNCHIFLGSSSLCTREAHRVAMYGFPANYNPFAPSKSTPPTAPRQGSGCTADLPAVPLSRLRAAESAGAGWLSADGLRTYRDDRSGIEVAFWDEEAGRFDSWWGCNEGLPADAVKMG